MLLTEYGNIDRKEALYLSGARDSEMVELFVLANRAKVKHSGKRIDLCSIINAKSGACPEDCSFCAQSSRSKSNIHVYPLIDVDVVLDAARVAREYGVRRFCTVTSGRAPSDRELDKICRFTSAIRDSGLLPCATLGMLGAEQLKRLKDAGLNRYHHNLETSEAFFSEICTTHTYREKIRTIEAAKSLGLSVCSGGIFGMGESWEDRIEMAFALRDIGVDSVPINFFTPIDGTSLAGRALLEPLEALKIIAIYRLILPESEIRICGGRPATLRDLNSQIFLAGADGLLLGDYLTTKGRRPEDDLQMIRDMGLEI
ncbi:MAG: biotin synthase BioB [Deferribacteres bacterium]|nr:biotin synthase BioB [Deferribacteres bacterium]